MRWLKVSVRPSPCVWCASDLYDGRSARQAYGAGSRKLKRALVEPISVPSLPTDRLLLTPIGAAHSRGVFDLWSNPDVCRFSDRVVDYDGNVLDTPCTSVRQSDKIIEFWEQAARDGWGFRWSICGRAAHSGEFMGLVGFNAVSPVAEIAYHLHPRFWGNSYMLEATTAAVAWATENLLCDRFEAYIDDENVRSIRLARRLEFKAEGSYRQDSQRYILPATRTPEAAS